MVFFCHEKKLKFLYKNDYKAEETPNIYTDFHMLYEKLNHILFLILCPFSNWFLKHLQYHTNSAAGKCQGRILNGEGKQTEHREISEKTCFYDPSTLMLWWSGTKRAGMAFLFLSSVSSSHSSLCTQFFSCSLTTHTSSSVRATPWCLTWWCC